MADDSTSIEFDAQLLRPKDAGDGDGWAFVVLPRDASATLPRRGRVTVSAKLNGHGFTVMLEPDGKKSHWLRIGKDLLDASGLMPGDVGHFEITPGDEPEPEVPADLAKALDKAPEARAAWDATTTIARVDWIH